VAVFHIGLRELRAMFNTVIAWMVLCAFLLMNGVFWEIYLTNYVMQKSQLVFDPYGAASLNLTEYLIVPWFGNCAVILLFVVPALSMRLFSPEFDRRTMELLLTSPISTLEIVLGKYLGGLGFVVAMLLCTAHVPASLYFWGEPEFGAIAGSYLGTFLMSSLLLAIGMFFSSLTKSQIVALILSFAASLILYVAGWAGDDPDSVLAHLGLATHLEDLFSGAVRLSDLVYFGAGISFFVFATYQRLESYRWS